MRTRIRVISAFIVLFALMCCVKLYSLQIIHADDFAEKADRQYQEPANAVFDRGTIYFKDQNGTLISAATLQSGFILSINPKLIQQSNNAEDAYQKINAILPIDHTDFITRAGKQNDTYEEIAKKVSEDDGTKIAALNIPGVTLYKDKWRYYPGNDLAAQTLGFMAYIGNDFAGRYGLERFYDNVLARDNSDMYVNFFAEIFSGVDKAVQGQQMEGDVVTTIDPDTQSYLQNMLEQVRSKYSAQSAGGIIMNPQTGEIYSMALDPTFDVNNFSSQTDPAIYRNDLVESVYEMGSVIKPLTMSVGIDLGKVNASSTYNDPGYIKTDGQTIYDFDKQAHGVTTLQTAMGQSYNVGFAYVASLVGNDELTKYFKSFGLGEKTGIDLPNEASGIISNLDSPRDLEHYTAAFGQGIAMTPIETIRALSIVANGGYLVTPHVADAINYRVGYTQNIDPPKGAQVIKASTSKAVTDMLVSDVDNVLLAGHAKNPHYSIAAKTGTAQIPGPGGTYYADEYLHSFIGYLPAYNPKFIVFLYMVNPRGVQYASETLAQPFIDLTKYLINYYQLPPDR
jgi:stage V sporulation protein D (sporulation-specific penicillin-binding protein)